MFLFWGIKSHGANTSFLRSYFCPECKAWHLTSAKNIGSSKSSGTTRNAGRNRRNTHPAKPKNILTTDFTDGTD